MTSREAKDLWESDQPVILRDGKAVHMGKGLTGIRNSQRKHSSDFGPNKLCQPNCGKQAIGSRSGYHTEASISEKPGAIVPHAGICAGGERVTALPTAMAVTSKKDSYS
jgi:hypothetical protein